MKTLNTQHEQRAPEARSQIPDGEMPSGEYGSVFSYPERCALWGDARYRGNCDGRLFLSLVERYRPRRVADPMLGSGTARDCIAWLNAERDSGIEFWGGDLKEGFDLETETPPGPFDLVWVHPPYWNIIRYSDDSRDLSTEADYGVFVERLRDCLVNCASALSPGGRIAVLVGDVRRKGSYYPIMRDVLNMESDLGQLRSVLIKLQHRCSSDSRSYRLEDAAIRHEYCLVFKRPRQ